MKIRLPDIEAMGKTVSGSFDLLSSNSKQTSAVSLDYGNTQQNTQEFASPTNLYWKENELMQHERLNPLTNPCQSETNCSRCPHCRRHFNDATLEMVKLLYPDFFAPDARIRLEQSANIDAKKYNDPIILSWMKMFGAVSSSFENVKL